MDKYLVGICDMLDTYGGRDKVMKALCYSAKLAAGLNSSKNPDISKKFAIFSSNISKARATLRLIDDIPMLKYSLEYGWGKKEPDKTMACLGVVANIIDHLFYPIEKICWLSEYKLLDVKDPDKWDTISSVFWVLSIYLNLMRTVRNFTIMEQHKNCSNTTDSREVIEGLMKKQRMEIISIVRLTIDFTHAVSTLPKGYLWGGKLDTWHVGFLGTLSAALGIYQYLAKKRAVQ